MANELCRCLLRCLRRSLLVWFDVVFSLVKVSCCTFDEQISVITAIENLLIESSAHWMVSERISVNMAIDITVSKESFGRPMRRRFLWLR